jgi:hypothetical protein
LNRLSGALVLVSQVQLDPGVGGRNPQFFADDRARRRIGNSSARASDRERKQEELAQANLHASNEPRIDRDVKMANATKKPPARQMGRGQEDERVLEREAEAEIHPR